MKRVLILLVIVAVISAEDYWQTKLKGWQSEAPKPNNTEFKISGKSTEAYVYLICTRAEWDNNVHINAALINIHRLKILNTPEYNSTVRDIIVLVCTFTPEWQIIKLKALDVIVLVVEPIVPQGSLPGYTYIDIHTKFQVFKLTNWERVLYLDMDTNLFKGSLKIWDEPNAQVKYSKPSYVTPEVEEQTYPPDSAESDIKIKDLYPYLFAAIQDCPVRIWNPAPYPWTEDYFNAGVWIIKPSINHFKAIIAQMNLDNLYRPLVDQSVLNAIYNETISPVPWQRLPIEYNLAYTFPEDVAKEGKTPHLIHCKFWGNYGPWMQSYHETWMHDFDYLVQNKPQSVNRIYNKDDIFCLKPTNKKEAYFLLLLLKGNFKALQRTITAIQTFESGIGTNRDIIVLAEDSTPEWQMLELQSSSSSIFTLKVSLNLVKDFSKKSLDQELLKIYGWKLTQWSRLLFITSADYLDTDTPWKTTQLNDKLPTEPPKQLLYNRPYERTKDFYPFLFAAVQGSKNRFNTDNFFMIKPSNVHFDYLIEILESNSALTVSELLNYAYNDTGPLPWSQITTTNRYQAPMSLIFFLLILALSFILLYNRKCVKKYVKIQSDDVKKPVEDDDVEKSHTLENPSVDGDSLDG